MDIEAIVKKYKEDAPLCSYDFDQYDAETMLRAALTELAAGYENRIIALNREVVEANERIRQLEAERVPDWWQGVTVEPTEYEIREACKALWESETHPMLARAGHNTNFDFLPETILLSLRKKVRAVRKAMLAAAPQQPKKEGE